MIFVNPESIAIREKQIATLETLTKELCCIQPNKRSTFINSKRFNKVDDSLFFTRSANILYRIASLKILETTSSSLHRVDSLFNLSCDTQNMFST